MPLFNLVMPTPPSLSIFDFLLIDHLDRSHDATTSQIITHIKRRLQCLKCGPPFILIKTQMEQEMISTYTLIGKSFANFSFSCFFFLQVNGIESNCTTVGSH